MTELTAQDVFRMHPRIRWAALASGQGEVIFSEMRPGVKSLGGERGEQERDAFMEIGPHILMGAFERLSPYAGPISVIFGDYEKIMMLISKINGNYLAFSIEKYPVADLPNIIPTLLASLQQLSREP